MAVTTINCRNLLCNGTGTAKLAGEEKPCPTCKGTGRMNRRFQNYETCDRCKGWGTRWGENTMAIEIVVEPCPKCSGLGMRR